MYSPGPCQAAGAATGSLKDVWGIRACFNVSACVYAGRINCLVRKRVRVVSMYVVLTCTSLWYKGHGSFPTQHHTQGPEKVLSTIHIFSQNSQAQCTGATVKGVRVISTCSVKAAIILGVCLSCWLERKRLCQLCEVLPSYYSLLTQTTCSCQKTNAFCFFVPFCLIKDFTQ